MGFIYIDLTSCHVHPTLSIQVPITSPPMQKSVLNSPTLQFDIEQAKLFQHYQQQQEQLQQMMMQQQSASIASTPTKEHIDPLSFVQATQLADVNAQQPSGYMEQDLSRMHSNLPPIQVGVSQIPPNAMVSPQISANTLVLDNLTYSEALKLPPEIVVPNVSQTTEIIPNTGVPPKPLDTQTPTQNVRKISRFQVSIVDPMLTASGDASNSITSNAKQNIQTNVPSSMAQPMQSTESPEQIEKQMQHNIAINNPVNISTAAQPAVNFAQIQPNFQPNVFHHQQIDNSGNAQQLSTNAANSMQMTQPGSLLSGIWIMFIYMYSVLTINQYYFCFHLSLQLYWLAFISLLLVYIVKNSRLVNRVT